eukprot:3239991-Amphidinium_carterae.2
MTLPVLISMIRTVLLILDGDPGPAMQGMQGMKPSRARLSCPQSLSVCGPCPLQQQLWLAQKQTVLAAACSCCLLCFPPLSSLLSISVMMVMISGGTPFLV